MSFTEQMEQAPERYRQYYIKYRELRAAISHFAQDADDSSGPRSRLMSRDLMNEEQPVGRFQASLHDELMKVNQFACVKHEDLFLSLRKLCEDCKTLGLSRGSGGSLPPEQLDAVAAKIEVLGAEVVHLDTYVRLNYVGFQKLTQHFDRMLGVSGSVPFVAGLQSEPFCNVRFDDILILLGLAWARLRAAQSSAEQSKDATWKPPESFIRNTSKYWVRPDKVVLLKTRIVRHLPYLLFGASTVDQEKLLEPFALLGLDYANENQQSVVGAEYDGSLEESQLLSSVYFDNLDGSCYEERIRREEGARLVRFRWYGENCLEPDKEIFVERKIHHEGWGGQSSAKERCIVPQKQIFSFMKGKLDIEEFFKRLASAGKYSEKARKAMKGICLEVNKMIQEKCLQPILRTSYYRCAFQLSTSNEVRISLDTQMTLLNELRPDGHTTPPWCHISSDLLAENEVYRFPFAILEIKLQNVSETPEWLRQTLADIGAIQVHKFSKFQHGMAFLHPERVKVLPHWHQDFAKWHESRSQVPPVRRRSDAEEGFQTRSSLHSIDDSSVPQVTATPVGEGGHLLKDMQNLDPKAVFANERTLLHYAEQGIYVSSVGVALLYRDGPTRVVGGILVVATAAFYINLLREYYLRLGRITSRASIAKSSLLRLDWAHGPLMVTTLIVLVCVISATLAAMTLEKSQEL